MKFIFTSFFLFCVVASTLAQNYSISNVVFDPVSPATLLPGEFVNITFDYTKTGGDIRIGIYTFKRPNSGSGTSGESGYTLKQDDAGTGDARFTRFNGAIIDSVTFQFVNLDWTLLYDTTIAVEFTFHNFAVNDLQFTPTSPGILGFGDSLKINYNYNKTWGDVKIQPFAISNNEIIEKQITSVSPVYTGATGTADGFIKIDSLASVDQIMFQFLDATTGDTLVEVERDVFFSFTNDTTSKYTISNVICDPPSPSILKLNQRVNISYDYTKPYGDVRIFVFPIISEGSWNYGEGGSALFVDDTGTGSSFFVFYEESKIEKLKFRVESVSGLILHEEFVDVFFTVTADSTLTYSITDVELTPPSSGTLNTGDTIQVKFNYTKPFGDVYFFVHPLSEGVVEPGFEVPNLGTFSADSGTVETYVIYDHETSFDKLRIQMQTLLNRVLFDLQVEADYEYQSTPFSFSDLSLTPASPDTINIRDSIRINFTYKNLLEQATVVVTPIKNSQEVSGFTSPNPLNLVNNSDAVGTYVIFNSETSIDQIRLQLTGISGTVYIDTLINASYLYIIPTSIKTIDQLVEPLVYPIPANNELNITVPAEHFDYSIVNLNGQILQKGFSASNKIKIDISKYESGVYFTKINYDGNQYSKMVVFK
jgi:hypothetical protein